MFYKNLNKYQIKAFDDYYKNNKHLYKRHEKDFITNDPMQDKANQLSMKNNKHLSWVNKNKKYNYDSKFSYLEKEDNLIIMYVYTNNWIHAILFFNLDTGEQNAYYTKEWKHSGIYIMQNANLSKGFGYSSGWDHLYNANQRLMDKKSIKILKEIDKFKYLPIEKFDKINYFKLLNATDEAIYNYELLIKSGAIKMATGLLLNRSKLDKELFKKHKKILIKNKSYDFILNEVRGYERENYEKIKKKKNKEFETKLNNYLSDLYKKKNPEWEFNDFIFRLPKDIEDIKNEGETLNHCIYSNRKYYFSDMMNKESIIIFLRNKNELDKPFFTIEINGDEINQVRTTGNQVDSKITELTENFLIEKYDEIMELYA